MLDKRYQEFMKAAGSANRPVVVRFYSDGDPCRERPSLVVQRDFQGVRILLRTPTGSDIWTSAWFADSGDLLSIEKFSVDGNALDSSLADGFLSELAIQPITDMVREEITLGE